MYEDGQSGIPAEHPAAEVPTGTATGGYEAVNTGTPGGTYNATGSAYIPPPGTYANQGRYAPHVVAEGGLSDTAAGALAYITIIPAILFLVLAPYNQKPFVKFHAFQCLGLGVAWICLSIIGVIPILGWIILLLGSLAMLVVWILCIVKASQGSALKLPVISKLASEQSGYLP